MPNLVSMKMSKKDSTNEFAVDSNDGPRFPHGLEIRLDKIALEKLGFTELPEVGTEMIIVAVGKVTSVHENKRQNSVTRSMEIQIEEIEVEPSDDGSDATAVDAVSRAVKDA